MARVLLTLVLLFLVGCGSTNPIREWKQELTNYTVRHGNGDINVLRESSELRSTQSIRPAQIRFDHQSTSKVDVRGVLVGQHAEGGDPTFFFLVGVVKRPVGKTPPRIQDIRLISCAVHQSQHSWNVGEPDPDAIQKYVTQVDGDAKDPQTIARSQEAFPRLSDDFQFAVRSGIAHVTEARSGAAWQLPIH